MRKIVVLSFLSLDGVMQAPGGPEEDTNGDFKLGGWTFPYFDEFIGQIMGEQMGKPFDLLLGRKTYQIFEGYWPHANIDEDPAAAAINKATKYVASTSLNSLEWSNSILLKGDVVQKIKTLKEDNGPDLQVHGSGNFIQTLLKNDLIDEFQLKIFPVTLGKGKRLFDGGSIPAAFKLTECKASPNGVIIANYERDGDVKTGSFV